MSDTSKVKPTHTQRAAVIYVRQSSPAQVENNRESTERQYALVQRAIDLGWPREQVTIIDEDLGVSGDGIAKRAGFAQLTADVALRQGRASCSASRSRAWRATTPTGIACSICAASPTP